MPFDRAVLESHFGRERIKEHFERSGRHGPRPAGRPRVLHLSMGRVLTRGPTETETSFFVKKLNGRIAELEAERVQSQGAE